jgi:RNA-directed DNA polymerase
MEWPHLSVELGFPNQVKLKTLGIPTIKDRAKQALAKLALEPEWDKN